MKTVEKLDERKKLVFDLIKDEEYKPMKIKEIATMLQIKAEDRETLEDVLNDLIKEGKVIKTKKGKYVRPQSVMMIVGKFIANPKGFGFVEIEGETEDIFIPGKYTNGAFHGDQVAIKLVKAAEQGRRKEGEVVEILSRGKSEVIGTYQKSRNFGFVIADNKKINKDIFIPKSSEFNAVNGDKVVVKITSWGDDDKKPEGEITEIIGNITDPETDILAIVRDLEIPSVFPEAVKQQAEGVLQEIKEEELKNRLDIRDLQTVTIDGEDAKDLDDAITIEKTDTGYTLGVHIADVTHYVTEGSPLDQEAIKRGTSVYLVDRVIPMLPRKLSNGICSLNQGEDRLALSCIMEIGLKGNVLSYKAAETVIHVDRRMTYTNVKKILEDHDEEVIAEYSELLDMFNNMEELARILRAKRKERGSIDFDFPEAKIIMDEKGVPIDIKPYDRNVATKIIEEFMLLANETIAESFFWQQMPFVYRTHEEPDPAKISNLAAFIYNFGYHIKGKEQVHPKELQKLLIDVEGSKEETIISRLTLRSMKKAMYTVTNDGHYGLAAKYYCHFTSPIRRYPDLQIHRIIKDVINGRMSDGRAEHYESILEKIAKQCSENERRAEEAERETEKLKKVEYMQDKIGQTFDGVISSVTSFGLFIELENTVEGLIHVSSMTDDYYNHDKDHHCYIGERTSKIYRIGDVVKIVVVGADKAQRTIDFELSDEDDEVKA
ncbi:MAG: ribonuclease R [Firmicutes bacterium HGW-Firmicutes-1]|jgi:ribonuclease R|nr:MAG: ribonuclease R [Firmicutes bacterium HGW-Firmicutes-1]